MAERFDVERCATGLERSICGLLSSRPHCRNALNPEWDFRYGSWPFRNASTRFHLTLGAVICAGRIRVSNLPSEPTTHRPQAGDVAVTQHDEAGLNVLRRVGGFLARVVANFNDTRRRGPLEPHGGAHRAAHHLDRASQQRLALVEVLVGICQDRCRKRRSRNCLRGTWSAFAGKDQPLLDLLARRALEGLTLVSRHHHGVVALDPHHAHLRAARNTPHDTYSLTHTNARTLELYFA